MRRHLRQLLQIAPKARKVQVHQGRLALRAPATPQRKLLALAVLRKVGRLIKRLAQQRQTITATVADRVTAAAVSIPHLTPTRIQALIQTQIQVQSHQVPIPIPIPILILIRVQHLRQPPK